MVKCIRLRWRLLWLLTTSSLGAHSEKTLVRDGACVSGSTRTNSTPTPCCNQQNTRSLETARFQVEGNQELAYLYLYLYLPPLRFYMCRGLCFTIKIQRIRILPFVLYVRGIWYLALMERQAAAVQEEGDNEDNYLKKKTRMMRSNVVRTPHQTRFG